MFYITSERNALRICKKYKTVAVFATSKNLTTITADDDATHLNYEQLTFLPSEDEINAIKAGDLKLKKVIKAATKGLHKPGQETAVIGLGMAQILTIITSNRKNDRGPAVLVFVLDPEDKERNKIMTKFLTAIFGEFGLTPQKNKTIKKLFKAKGKKKKARRAIIRKVKNHVNNTKGAHMSSKGAELKHALTVFYELELRQSAIKGLQITDLGNNAAEQCATSLTNLYAAENLKQLSKGKFSKQLAKKNRAAVKAYKSFAAIIGAVNDTLRLPKVKYGAKWKGKGKNKKCKGSKMNTKKFIKYYKKRNNRAMLFLIYSHTMAVLAGLDIGTKDYNTVMKAVCKKLNNDDFTKAYVSAANAYAKEREKNSITG